MQGVIGSSPLILIRKASAKAGAFVFSAYCKKRAPRFRDARFFVHQSCHTGQCAFDLRSLCRLCHCTPRRTTPKRSELALTCCFRLLLALYGRLLIMLTLPNFSDHAVFCARTLETLESGIQGLVLTNAYFCHEFFPPFVQRQRLFIKMHPEAGHSL